MFSTVNVRYSEVKEIHEITRRNIKGLASLVLRVRAEVNVNYISGNSVLIRLQCPLCI